VTHLPPPFERSMTKPYRRRPGPSRGRWLAAWSVHLLTATGVVVGFLALGAIHRAEWVQAFWWMAAALVIDSADGTLARAVGVKTVLPRFDGARLDDLVDYLNYTVVPVALICAAGRLPGQVATIVAAAVLVSSAYGFCQTDAKTTDGYFKGFPSYWNVVVFYLFALEIGPWQSAAVLLGFAILVFVPVYYVYPSKAPRCRTATIVLGIVWGACTLIALVLLPDAPRALLYAGLLYPAFYFCLSFYLTLGRRAGPSET
jgi:phosphatidylcholine synthase